MNLTYNPSFIGFFNTCQIDRCFFCILHFHGHHQCRVVRSCFICKLVTSSKLAFISLQNSRCKYSPMHSEFQFKERPSPLEFQFKELPLALGIPKRPCLSWCMDIFWNCPICSCKLTNFSDADLHVVRLVYNTKHIIQLEEGYAWASHIPLKHDGTLTKVILQQDTEHNAVFLSRK